jgi:hypothetical protein
LKFQKTFFKKFVGGVWGSAPKGSPLQANGAAAPRRVVLNKEAAYKATHLFSLKVYEIPKNFFQKVFWWGLGQSPNFFFLKNPPSLLQNLLSYGTMKKSAFGT